MMQHLSTHVDFRKCEINISSGKNRQKTYGKNLYFRDGQNFEIEVYNPRKTSVLVKVKLNGNYISSSGLVVRPGQRVWLERYLDENRKFLFETYDVENSESAKQAIENNGNVLVEIYYESVPVQQLNQGWPYYGQNWYVGTGSPNTPFFGTTSIGTTSITYTSGVNTSGVNSSNLRNADISDAISYFADSLEQSSLKSLETGRIGKGESSEQSFVYVNENFNSYVSETHDFKILPISAKLPEAREIRQYCVSCGCRKKKDNWKFCPDCGEKFE